MYLDEPIPFHANEEISGTIEMRLEGEKNDKTLIKVASEFKGKATTLSQSRTYKYG